MAEYRAPRTWLVESRNGRHYATNQFGGFTQYATLAEAVSAIDKDVEQYGDIWEAPSERLLAASKVRDWRITTKATAED